MEFLREKLHLRVRTNTIAALARIRNCLAYATHEFFQTNGFLYVHTPIVTASDCEGAGEMFQARAAPSARSDAAGSSRGRRILASVFSLAGRCAPLMCLRLTSLS